MTTTTSRTASVVAVCAFYAALAAVCLVIGTVHTTEAIAVQTRFVDVRDGNCLTPQQDSELKKAIAGIQVTLNAAIISLDIAAAAEKDPTTKSDLKEAALVLKEVSVYLVGNLTKIAESACGNCSQIVRVVNETVQAIEQTISNIDPNWKNETLWKVIVTVIDDIVQIAEMVCPNKAAPLAELTIRKPSGLGESCLNASQLHLLEKITAGIQIVLTSAEVALEIAEHAESDPTVKKDLQEAIVIIQAISQDLVANLTKIAKSPCANCTDIVNIVNEAINDIEAALTRINPDWENDPLWKSIISAIQQILDYIKVLCPDSADAVATFGAKPAMKERTYTFVY